MALVLWYQRSLSQKIPGGTKGSMITKEKYVKAIPLLINVLLSCEKDLLKRSAEDREMWDGRLLSYLCSKFAALKEPPESNILDLTARRWCL